MTVRDLNYANAVNLAEQVYIVKNKHLLLGMNATDICLADTSVIHIQNWEKIRGYRLPTEDYSEKNREEGIAKIIDASLGSGGAFVYFIKKEDGKASLLLGNTANRSVYPFVDNYLPETDMEKRDINNEFYPFNAVISGEITMADMSDIFFSSDINNAYICMICKKLSTDEIDRTIQKDKDIRSYLSSYVSVPKVYGSGSRKVENGINYTVRKAIDVIDNEVTFFGKTTGEMVKVIFQFGAKTSDEYARTKAIMRTVIPSNTTSYNHDVMLDLGKKTVGTYFYVPFLKNEKIGKGKIDTYSIQTVNQVSQIGIFPQVSADGFLVKNYHINEDAAQTFDICVDNNIAKRKMELGIDTKGTPIEMGIDEFKGHAFITGITNSGKTNTIKQIIHSCYSKKVPVLIIESAKKEYAQMINDIPELNVLSGGKDGNLLRFNPLHPVDGVLIETHIDAVVRALTAAYGNEHPLPEAFAGLLRQVYKGKGWNTGMLAYTDNDKPFPTFKDVALSVAQYVDECADYGSEVKQNLLAALNIRIDDLTTGSLGEVTEFDIGINIEDLINEYSLIELSDLSESGTSFIINVLLFDINNKLSRQDSSEELKRIIVIEEAHNIFKKTVDEDSLSATNNKYFEKMLAEVRASGTGMIICDQRPSEMCRAVIANTNIKIVHRLNDGDDIKVVLESVGLSEFQGLKIRELSSGECILSEAGQYGHYFCKVNKVDSSQIENCACLFCKSRYRCRKVALIEMIESMDENMLNYYVSQIERDVYNSNKLLSDIDDMFEQLNIHSNITTKSCFLGLVLSKHNTLSTIEKRIITATFVDEMGRR